MITEAFNEWRYNNHDDLPIGRIAMKHQLSPEQIEELKAMVTRFLTGGSDIVC